MELQGELDAQEDHDRWTLQLHLLLECAAMLKLHHAVRVLAEGREGLARAVARNGEVHSIGIVD